MRCWPSRSAGALPSGLGGEPLRLVACDGILAAVGDVAVRARRGRRPRSEAHDAAVRRLAAAASALLPARFGSVADDDGQLCDALRDRVPALREALQRRARVRSDDAALLAAGRGGGARRRRRVAAEAGPGTRYLAARRAAAGDPRALPEVRAVLDALAPFVRGERRERHERPPLLASVYHLVPRDGLDAYRAALDAATREARASASRAAGPGRPTRLLRTRSREARSAAAQAGRSRRARQDAEAAAPVECARPRRSDVAR